MSKKSVDESVQTSGSETPASFGLILNQIHELFKDAAPDMTVQEHLVLLDIQKSVYDSTFHTIASVDCGMAEKVKDYKKAADATVKKLQSKSDGVMKCVQKKSKVKDCFNFQLRAVQNQFKVLELEREKQEVISRYAFLEKEKRKKEIKKDIEVRRSQAKNDIEAETLRSRTVINTLLRNTKS